MRRVCLAGVVVIMDVRRPFTPADEQLVAWTVAADLPAHLVLNKCDKLSRGAAASALAQACKTAERMGPAFSVQLFSALKGTGVDELRAALDRWFGG